MWSQTDIFTWKYLNIIYIGTVWPASQAPMTGIKVFGGFFYNLKQFDMGFNMICQWRMPCSLYVTDGVQ
jgi:hypothetical protein